MIFRFEGILENQGDWSGVAEEYQEEWENIYYKSKESLNLSAPCPICSTFALHRWYQVGKSIDRVIEGSKFIATGALWEWLWS